VIRLLMRSYVATEDAIRSAAEFGWVVYLALKSRSRR
jgi:hypothetical protein